MAKNSKKKSKKETITILKIDYDFLIAQNENLKKRNRELQTLLKGRSRGVIGVIDSIGKTVLDKYVGRSNKNEY
nr:MAG TPA: Homeobox associated leucine zipper [Caudoviricetes sp.]